MARFQDRTLLVTGAGSGIGRAATLKLAAEGASIFATVPSKGAFSTVRSRSRSRPSRIE